MKVGVALFADHIGALPESFDSILADVGNPYFGNWTDTLTEG